MPVKQKTSNSKTRDRKAAVISPQAAAKPQPNGKSQANAKPRSNGKPEANAKSRPNGKPEATAKSQPNGKPKRSTKLKSVDGPQVTKSKSSLKSVVIDALADMKALEVKVLDVRGLTDIADFMVIASGTSDRHVRSVAQRVVERTKEAGFRPHGVEGQQDADWVLIDLSEMIVHVMLPRVREFYGLEKLWDMTATKRAARA